MNIELDFLVIGAQKCATSWIYYCLKDHPGLSLPEKKREIEYLGGDLFEQKGPEWYFSLFNGSREEQKTGAVSIEYMFDQRSPGVVHRLAPNVKLIASLRNPIDRAVSGYFWYLRKDLIPDKGLEQTIRIALEELKNPSGEKIRKTCSELLSRGFYDIQLARYLELFDPGRFLFVLYEDVQSRPVEVISGIYEFLGVAPSFIPSSIGSRPKQNTYLKPLIAMERIAGRSRALGKAMDFVNTAVAGLGLNPRKPEISAELHAELEELYAPHIRKTQEIIEKVPPAQRPFSANLIEAWFGKGQR